MPGPTTPEFLDRSTIPSGDSQNFDETLKWVHAVIDEGEKLVSSDPSYDKMEKMIDYVMGEQFTGKAPTHTSRVVINRVKKSIKQHVSALTDLRPLFAYKTSNPAYESHSHLLNQLVVLWWINTFADLQLATALQYAHTLGYGWLVCEYDPNFGQYGDNRLIPKDPRDVLPIRPSRELSVQDWMGVVIKESHSINVLKAAYPDKVNLLQLDKHRRARHGKVRTMWRRLANLITPVSTLDGLKGRAAATDRDLSDGVPVYRLYFKDPSINTSSEAITMGNPQSNWAYNVAPGMRLYPRGRSIVATDAVVLYDGPNPYWHGRFPAVKISMDPWPWLLGGLALAHDLLPAQEGLNKIVNDILTVLAVSADRGTIFDKNAVSEDTFRNFDSRKAGWKLRVNPVFGESVKVVDPPTLPSWTMEFLSMFLQEFDNLAGTANLQALLSLRQSPSGETIQKYLEALTPEIRLEGRYLESALREVAEILKCNIFQFYSTQRRIIALGDAGLQLEDLDYNPGNLVPSMAVGAEGYTPELDKSQPPDKRAQFFMGQFSFFVAPGSLLAMHATERKMMYLQLSRLGFMDFWSLMEMLEIPNVGTPPPTPLPTGEMMPGIDPMTGQVTQVPVTEIRVPQTITERLIAQAQLGIGMSVSPAGRKASGEEPPKMETKSDSSGAPRSTITES